MLWFLPSPKLARAAKARPILRERRYALRLNNMLAPQISVLVPREAHAAMRDLRHYVSPRYDTFYLIRRKKAFNTLFFQQPYDVIMCDRNFRVINLFSSVEPGYISEYHNLSYFIFFTPQNTINHLNINLNDQLQVVRLLLSSY